MEDKKTLDKLAKIAEHLKAISDKLSVVAGVDSKGGSTKKSKTLTPEEVAKVKATATETAKVYKTVLGLGFNQKNVDDTANRFRVILGITPFYNSFKKTFESIKTYMQNDASNKTKIDTKDQIKLSDLEKIFDKKKLYENSLISNLSNISSNTLKTYDALDKNNTDKDILSELQKISNSSDLAYNFISTDVLNKDILSELSNMNNILGINSPKDYSTILNDIKNTLTGIGTSVQTKVYEPLLTTMLIKIEELKSSFDTKIGKIKASASEYVRSANAFKKLLGWDELRYAILDYVDRSEVHFDDLNDNIEKLVTINDQMKDKMGGKDSKGTKEGGDSIMSKIGKIAGLLALGAGLFLIVNALVSSGKIDIMQVVKVMAIIGAFVGLFVLVSKAGEGIRNASIGFAILSATLLFLVLPLMEKLSKIAYPQLLSGLVKMAIVVASCIGLMVLMNFIKASEVIKSSLGLALLIGVIGFLAIPFFQYLASLNFDTILEGLFKFAIIFGACFLMMFAMQKIKAGDVVKSSLGLTLLTLLMGFVVIPLLLKMSTLPFDKILTGLALMGLSVLGLAAIVRGTGEILTRGKGAGVSSVVGLIAIGLMSLVLGYLADTLVKFADKPWQEILIGIGAASLAIVAFGAVVLGVGYIVTKAMVSFAAGLVAIGLLMLVMYGLSKVMDLFAGEKDWATIYTNLGLATLAIVAFGVVVGLVGAIAMVAAPFLAVGAATFLGLMLVMAPMMTVMNLFAGEVDWSTIYTNLGLATLAITAFGVVVGIVGAIAIAAAPFLAVGAVTFGALILIMGGLVDTLIKFNQVDAGQIGELGKSLVLLGAGLIAFLGGSVAGAAAGIVNGLTGLFKLDPASQIKKFETIDSEKIYKLGMGLMNMAQGLKELSNGSINLKDITNQLMQMTKPLTDFSSALDAFSNAYAKIDKVKLQSEYTMNVEKDDSIQQAIKSLHEQELSVQQAQLAQLQQNGEYLRVIASSGGAGGGGGQQGGSSGGGQQADRLSGPNFETKDKYMSNLKLTTMSFEA